MNSSVPIESGDMVDSQSLIDKVGYYCPNYLVLAKILVQNKWQGSFNDFVSYIENTKTQPTLDEVRDILFNMGFTTEKKYTNVKMISMFELPTIIEEKNQVFFVHQNENDELVAEADDGSSHIIGGGKVKWLVIHEMSKRIPKRGTWFTTMSRNYNRFFLSVLILSLVNAILGLALPLFTMSVYDFLIPSGSINGLVAVGSGALIALLWIVANNRLRSHLLSTMSARLHFHSTQEVLKRIINLPSALLMQSSATNNVSRMKSLERIREFLSGTMTVSLFDAPFIIVALIAIAILSGYLVIVPILGVLIYAGLSLYFENKMQQRAEQSGAVNERLQTSIKQAVEGANEQRQTDSISPWLDKLKQRSVRAARANFDYKMVSAAQQAVGKMLNMSIALCTLVVGIQMVMAGAMTTGGLIAAMMLIWRVTGPMQVAFFSSVRHNQYKSAVAQVNAMVDSATMDTSQTKADVEACTAHIDASRLVFRYNAERDAALNGVTFQSQPGQKIALVGENGAGKTTLLHMLGGLYQPQAGSIQLDGHDIRQFSNVDYAKKVVLISHAVAFIDGTVEENIAFFNPLATDEEIASALSLFAVQDILLSSYEGLQTMLSKDGQVQVDSMTCLAIQFVIAKLNNPLIYLLDDVYDGSDHPIANAIKAFIQNVSSDEVIIFATHNKNLMLDADIAVVMSAGAVERVAELNNEDPEANTVSGNDATNEANDKNNPELQKAGE